jgi:hypothetical protein
MLPNYKVKKMIRRTYLAISSTSWVVLYNVVFIVKLVKCDWNASAQARYIGRRISRKCACDEQKVNGTSPKQLLMYDPTTESGHARDPHFFLDISC